MTLLFPHRQFFQLTPKELMLFNYAKNIGMKKNDISILKRDSLIGQKQLST